MCNYFSSNIVHHLDIRNGRWLNIHNTLESQNVENGSKVIIYPVVAVKVGLPLTLSHRPLTFFNSENGWEELCQANSNGFGAR